MSTDQDRQRVQRPPKEPKEKKPPVFAITIAMLPVKWFGSLLLMIIGSLFISIIMEMVCMTFLWSDEGSDHSYKILEKEIGYLNKDFKKSIFKITPYEFAEMAATNSHHYLFEKTGLNDLLKALQRKEVMIDSPKTAEYIQIVFFYTKEYIQAAMNITELIAVRVAIALLSLPAFIFIAIAAVVDGLVERDLRRFGGGLERGMVYHYIKPHSKPIIIISWMLYLSIPINIHPNFIFVPAAILFGLVIYITTSSFKKFL